VLDARKCDIAAGVAAGDPSSVLLQELCDVTAAGCEDRLDTVGLGAVGMTPVKGNTVIRVGHYSVREETSVKGGRLDHWTQQAMARACRKAHAIQRLT